MNDVPLPRWCCSLPIPFTLLYPIITCLPNGTFKWKIECQTRASWSPGVMREMELPDMLNPTRISVASKCVKPKNNSRRLIIGGKTRMFIGFPTLLGWFLGKMYAWFIYMYIDLPTKDGDVPVCHETNNQRVYLINNYEQLWQTIHQIQLASITINNNEWPFITVNHH